MTTAARSVRRLALAALLSCAAIRGPVLMAHAPLEDQIAALDARVRDDPSNGGLRLRRGELHRALGNWSAALTDFAAARRLDPDLTVPDLGIGRVMIAS